MEGNQNGNVRASRYLKPNKRTQLVNGEKILNGRYEVLKCIHSKGMANVYIVQDTNLGKQWCLKEIRKSEAGRKNIEYISLLQEANILRSLNHERIPRIVNIDDEGDSLFVVMDFLDGMTLKSFVDEKGKIPEEMAVKWMLQVVQTMGYLHSERAHKKPIFYRDMKPDNLMIRPNGTINIFDFGISVRVESKDQLPDYTLGTPGYVAPEQKRKDLPVDLRSDIYSMGMTFYFMLTGIDPRGFLNSKLKPVSDWSPEVSPALIKIIDKCLKENPKDRYQDCEELQYALENYRFSDEKYKASARRKVFSVLIIGILGVLIGIGSIIPFMLDKAEEDNVYQNAILVAKQSGRLEDYDAAISLRPTELAPYEGYLEAIKQDGVFSQEEEGKLLNHINPNLQEIKGSGGYGKLAFEIGKLYWFYYQGSLSGESGSSLSIRWFEDAISKGYETEEAQVYYDLGVFNRDISKSVIEASDSGMYKGYWDRLMSIKNVNTSDIVTFQTNISIAKCISSYANNLRKDGVSYDEIAAEIERLEGFEKNYNEDESTLDVISGLRKDLRSTLNGLKDRVKVVYNVSGGGE